jgi:hypothetical protein
MRTTLARDDRLSPATEDASPPAAGNRNDRLFAVTVPSA